MIVTTTIPVSIVVAVQWPLTQSVVEITVVGLVCVEYVVVIVEPELVLEVSFSYEEVTVIVTTWPLDSVLDLVNIDVSSSVLEDGLTV